MKEQLKEIAERIYTLRDIFGVSIAEMAEATGLSSEEYEAYERGDRDFSFSFLYNVSKKFGMDMTEMFTGNTPRLSTYSVIRKNEGLQMERNKHTRGGFIYNHLAYLVKDRIADPFLVRSTYDEEDDKKPLFLSQHEGQEMDFILEGKLRCSVDGKEFVLEPGDALYYDSGHPHGMQATGGEDCVFLAVVMKYKANPKGGEVK